MASAPTSAAFIVETTDNLVYKFTFQRDFKTEDFKKFLGLLSAFLDKKKPFAFYIDASKATLSPIGVPTSLASWMKLNKPRIKSEGNLIASSVVFKSAALTAMLRQVFKLQTPVSPNLITTDVAKAEAFVRSHIEGIKHS